MRYILVPALLASLVLLCPVVRAAEEPPPRLINTTGESTVYVRPDEVVVNFGVETFNTFNHPQFEAVGTQLNTATYGFVTDARDPRVVQLRAKVSF